MVFGVSYSADFKQAEYKCVDSLEGLEELRGSKYCETVKQIWDGDHYRSVYEVLEERLKQNVPVLFVGLGCDVGGAKAYCERNEIDTSCLYTIEILCHGPTVAEVHKQYIEELENKYKSKVKWFSVRYKKEGWTPPYIRAEFANGEEYVIPFYETDYGFAFAHFSRKSCYNCKFRGSNHVGDITCGDYWGITESMSGWNENGVSVLIVKTTKGEELVQAIDKDSYHIEQADTVLALENNPMYFECRSKDIDYERFENNLKNKGLHYAVSHFSKNPLRRIKRALLKIIHS